MDFPVAGFLLLSPKPVMPPELELYDTSICTIRDFRDIQIAISKGTIDFTENKRWVAAKRMLDESDPQKTILPVLLADSTKEQRGIMAWGRASKIEVTDSQTRIMLEDIKEIPARPLISALCCQRTQEFLSSEDQRNYRIVDTPEFVYDAPKTFLLTWNPKKDVPIERLQKIRQELIEGESSELDWTCYSTNKARPGDRFLMLRLGGEPRGIVGCGWLRSYSEASEDDHTPRANILWDWIVDLDQPLNPRTIAGAEGYKWSPQQSGTELNEEISETVWLAWVAWVERDGERLGDLLHPEFLKDEDKSQFSELVVESSENTVSSLEGRFIESWSKRRERDPTNRARCLARYEARCMVCDMSFLEEYGEIGLNFIHVHHEQPLGGVTHADGVLYHASDDLKPVCPNCHAMLHNGLDARKGEVRTIAELRDIRVQAKARMT